jgi:hypothetical protein
LQIKFVLVGAIKCWNTKCLWDKRKRLAFCTECQDRWVFMWSSSLHTHPLILPYLCTRERKPLATTCFYFTLSQSQLFYSCMQINEIFHCTNCFKLQLSLASCVFILIFLKSSDLRTKIHRLPFIAFNYHRIVGLWQSFLLQHKPGSDSWSKGWVEEWARDTRVTLLVYMTKLLMGNYLYTTCLTRPSRGEPLQLTTPYYIACKG